MLMRAFRALLLLLLVQPCAAFAAGLPEGDVTLARARGDAEVLWDATPALAALIAKKDAKGKIDAELQADAAEVLVDRAPSLHNAKTITVVVLYALTGAVNPAYKVATFTGIERYMTLKASIADALKNGSGWAAALRSGRQPSGLTAQIIGKLPPQIPK